ncbi:unnamed protein product [Phytomonas sp. Hart1]|nr:unnamed protein product [Phytomonas sp. Hart1]|eukprot:CCW71344.1 unnamed protein product [Phytomonas sp. isolate Hart1]
MFSPSKPMRPPRPRPQDNNNGIHYLHSDRHLSGHKDSVEFRHCSPHDSKYTSYVSPLGVQCEKNDRIPDNLNHNLHMNHRVRNLNCSILSNSAITNTSRNCMLKGHISKDQNLYQPSGNACQHAMQVGSTKRRYNNNSKSRNGETMPIRGFTPQFNRYHSCTKIISQRKHLEPRSSFPLILFSDQPESLCQTKALLDRDIDHTQHSQQQTISMLPATKVSNFNNASHENGDNFEFSTPQTLLPQVPSYLRCQTEPIIPNNQQRNDNEGRQCDSHDANILCPKKTTFKLSNEEETKVSHKQYHHHRRLPFALNLCAIIEDRNVLMSGEAIDINVKEKNIQSKKVLKPTFVPLYRCPSAPVFPPNTFSHMHFNHFSMQSLHRSSMQFDTKPVLVLKTVRITPLSSRARLPMRSLLASVSCMQNEPQECEGIFKGLGRTLNDDSGGTNITKNLHQLDVSSVHDSPQPDALPIYSAKECTALQHMSVGLGRNPSSMMPSQHPITHTPNDTLCNRAKNPLRTGSLPHPVTKRKKKSTHHQHSLSHISILEVTAQVVLEMIGKQPCSNAPLGESIPIKITPKMTKPVIVTKVPPSQLSPQIPTGITQNDKHALSFTMNSNAYSSKKSLGTFGLTRLTATTPEESTEIAQYGSECVYGIEFSRSPINIHANPRHLSKPFNNSVLSIQKE